jgi:hypothetical protein
MGRKPERPQEKQVSDSPTPDQAPFTLRMKSHRLDQDKMAKRSAHLALSRVQVDPLDLLPRASEVCSDIEFTCVSHGNDPGKTVVNTLTIVCSVETNEPLNRICAVKYLHSILRNLSTIRAQYKHSPFLEGIRRLIFSSTHLLKHHDLCKDIQFRIKRRR